MSFFAKLKQFAGIGTLDVKLQVPGHFQATDSVIAGSLHITAKSDQAILKIDIELLEDFQTGRGDDKKDERYTLGALHLNQPFEMKADETRTIPFELPFSLLKSGLDHLKDKGGVLGGLGKMGAWAADEKSTYQLAATVDVKGTSLDPSHRVDMKLVK